MDYPLYHRHGDDWHFIRGEVTLFCHTHTPPSDTGGGAVHQFPCSSRAPGLSSSFIKDEGVEPPVVQWTTMSRDGDSLAIESYLC